jgi:hypothetical protein
MISDLEPTLEVGRISLYVYYLPDFGKYISELGYSNFCENEKKLEQLQFLLILV